MASLYKTSLGVKIEITLDYNLTGNTGVTYLVRKPDETETTWTPTVDNTVLGITSYLTQTNDLSQVGTYTIQPKVSFTGKMYFGTFVTFNVEDVIEV